MSTLTTKVAQWFRVKMNALPAFIVISDSPHCPCFKTYDVMKESRDMFAIKINPAAIDEATVQIKQLQSCKQHLLCLHGDSECLSFFYFHYNMERNKDQKVYLSDDWVRNLNKGCKMLYLHACNGVEILKGNRQFRETLKSWVAHSGPVYGFHSTNQDLNKVRYLLLSRITSELSKKNVPQALKTAIIAAHLASKADLEELAAGYQPGQNCNKAYISHVIACLAKNINSIQCSTA